MPFCNGKDRDCNIISRENEQTSTRSLFTINCKEAYNSESKRSFVLLTKYASETVGEPNWNNIQWYKAKKTVRLLQERIVKAKQRGQNRKVKSLQFILTKSFSARVLAVKKVTENKGKRTSGVDHSLWSTSKTKWEAALNLNPKDYQAKPLRRVSIPKSNGKTRNLGIPTMRDRAFQALYLQALEPLSETTADKNSYGFRKERSCADAIRQCFIVLGRSTSSEWILEGDIKGCFDYISHEWLLANIAVKKKILNQWLKSGFIENNSLFPTKSGTPQGGIISPTLANMTLDGMESLIDKLGGITKYGKDGTKRNNQYQLHFVRYADDFIVTCNDRDFLEKQVKPAIIEFLKARGLTLSEEKTKLSHIDDGFDFLGQNIRKYKGKLLIKPSKKSYKAIIQKIRKLIEKNKTISAENLIKMLNPIIRGWCNYHKKAISSRIFARLDFDIFRKIWSWAKRRHHDKSMKWIKAKYFSSIRGRNWVFYAKITDKMITLYSAQSTKLSRHLKIRNVANPFDANWNEYFIARRRRGKNLRCRII